MIDYRFHDCKHADKQASKQASKQTSKQESKQSSKYFAMTPDSVVAATILAAQKREKHSSWCVCFAMVARVVICQRASARQINDWRKPRNDSSVCQLFGIHTSPGWSTLELGCVSEFVGSPKFHINILHPRGNKRLGESSN